MPKNKKKPLKIVNDCLHFLDQSVNKWSLYRLFENQFSLINFKNKNSFLLIEGFYWTNYFNEQISLLNSSVRKELIKELIIWRQAMEQITCFNAKMSWCRMMYFRCI